jgi:hypothetical protein
VPWSRAVRRLAEATVTQASNKYTCLCSCLLPDRSQDLSSYPSNGSDGNAGRD